MKLYWERFGLWVVLWTAGIALSFLKGLCTMGSCLEDGLKWCCNLSSFYEDLEFEAYSRGP